MRLYIQHGEGVVQQLGQPPVRGEHDDPIVLQLPQLGEVEGAVIGAVQPPQQGVVLVADEKDPLPHDQLIGQLGQVGGDVHDAEVDDAVLRQLGQLGHGGLVEDHLHVGELGGEQGQDVGQQHGPPPGGHTDVQHRAVPVLNVPQVAEQLPVQIALPLQIGIEHLTCGGEGEWCVGAVHQGHPQGVLQLGQILAEIGLGEIEPLRRFGDAPLLDDGHKIFRILDEHKQHTP